MKHLVPNPHIEFSEASGKPLPSMKEYRVSAVYSLSEGDETLFDASLASVITHFPTAFEVVAVVCAGTEYLFESVVEKHEANAPFPILLVGDDCSLIDKGTDPERGRELVRTRRRLTADDNSQGAYVLHMDAASILIQEVTYDVVFHFGKPVMPYGRHPTGECEHHNSKFVLRRYNRDAPFACYSSGHNSSDKTFCFPCHVCCEVSITLGGPSIERL